MDGTSNRGLLYADDVSIVLRSLRGLGRMVAAFVEVFGTFGLSISESKMETMCMSIPRASATKIVFNATGQQYCQTTSFTYLEGTVTETPNLSDEIDRRIRAGWMSFKSYMRELYDRPKACLLPLKDRRGIQRLGRAGYDDFVPGEVTKTAPSGDETTVGATV